MSYFNSLFLLLFNINLNLLLFATQSYSIGAYIKHMQKMTKPLSPFAINFRYPSHYIFNLLIQQYCEFCLDLQFVQDLLWPQNICSLVRTCVHGHPDYSKQMRTFVNNKCVSINHSKGLWCSFWCYVLFIQQCCLMV